jgi:hypothetical protein
MNDEMNCQSPGAAADGVDLDRVWVNVAAEVWCRSPGRLERSAARLLGSPGLARALLATPSLLLPWLISSVVVLGVGVAAEVGAGRPLIWLIAPVLAAVGIAYAYGPGIDPAWELACSMAISDRLVLLTRAFAVLAVNAALGLAASAATIGTRASADAAPVTFGWLIPMAAVCALTLAVAVAVRSASVGAGAGVAAWIVLVLAKGAVGPQFTTAVTDANLYLLYLAVAACGAAIVVYATRPQRGLQLTSS